MRRTTCPAARCSPGSAARLLTMPEIGAKMRVSFQVFLRDAQGGLGLHDPRFGEFHFGLRQAQGCLSDDIRSFVNLKLVVGHGAFFTWRRL